VSHQVVFIAIHDCSELNESSLGHALIVVIERSEWLFEESRRKDGRLDVQTLARQALRVRDAADVSNLRA
jgi:hypothetical protein